MLKLEEIKNNPMVREFLEASRETLKLRNYTDHGVEHAEIVSKEALRIARNIGLSKEDQQLAAIAGYLHDWANFLSRTYHNYLGSLIFLQLFGSHFNAHQNEVIMQAIAQHDDVLARYCNAVSAVVTLADKSDVRRSRVIVKDINIIKEDIHNRVNYAVTDHKLKINKKKKLITLALKIDTNFVPVMEYFEIFTGRMNQCSTAAQYLHYKFGLIINKFRLL